MEGQNLSRPNHIVNLKNIIQEETDVNHMIKRINRYLINNPDVSTINTKDLNAEIVIEGYAFTKNKGQQTLVKKYYTPMCRSKNKDNNIEQIINEQLFQMQQQIDLLMKEVSELKNIIKNITQK